MFYLNSSTKGLFALMIALLLSSCANNQPIFTSPKGYDLNSPESFSMNEDLYEISGVVFDGKNDNVIFAIQDESGKVFRFSFPDRQTTSVRFGKDGDYEDVTIFRNRFVVLRSDGSFYFFPLADSAQPTASNVTEWKKILPKGEYESLFADPITEKLYVLCKSCKTDNKKNKVTGYQLSVDSNTVSITNTFSLTTNFLTKKKDKKKTDTFKPSAIARNPITRQWYILSSVNKMLVVADDQWNVVETHALNAKLFGQPEGIAFDTKGNLYISNEGGITKQGKILKFLHH